MFSAGKTISSVFGTTDLKDDTYFEYSEQFLTQDEKDNISRESDKNSATQLRAHFLFKSGKDPFSPPENSLNALGLTVKPERVEGCFKRAHELYRQITERRLEELEPARLYKLGWATEATQPAIEKLEDVWKHVILLKNDVELEEYIQALETTNQNITKALSENKALILKAIAQMSPYSRSNVFQQAFKKVKKNIIEQSSNLFFKSEKNYHDLQLSHSVYDPKDDGKGNTKHSWGTNLTWTLAHLKRGNTFIVCSDILSNQYRSHYKDTPCAFARELCVALKAGYTLCKNETGVTLKPPSLTPEYLQRCDSTGVLGDGVNPTYDEIEGVYRLLAEAHWEEQQDFECSFNFKDGAVHIQIINMKQAESGQIDRQHLELKTEPGGVDIETSNINVQLAGVLDSLTDFGRNVGELSGRAPVLSQFTPKPNLPDQTATVASVPISKSDDLTITKKPQKPK